MKVEVITNLSEFRELESIWNELLNSSEDRDNVFLRHEWIDSWFYAFGASRQMHVLLCLDNEGIVGILPLMISKSSYKGFDYKRLGFIEDANSPSLNIISRQRLESPIIEEMIAFLMRETAAMWDIAVLNKISIAASSYPLLVDHFQKHNIKHIVRSSMDSPYIETSGSYESFLQKTTPKFRKQLRNKINRLAQQGKIDIEAYETIGEGGKYLEEAMSVSSRSWKHHERTSMIGSVERENFFRKLSHIAQKNGWLRIWLLRLDGKPIAMEYHLEYNGITHAMRGDFDEAYEHLSPGSVLEAAIIENCFSKSLREYDFCGLPYGYKVRWTPKLHERKNLIFYPKRGYPFFLYLTQKHGPEVRRIFSRCARIFQTKATAGK